MLFLLFTFEDDHRDVGVLLRLGHLLFNFAHELNVDVDVFVWCKLSLHGSDSEHLLCDSLLHPEIKADWVLALILEVKWELLWLANSHCSEVKLGLNGLIKSNVESLGVDGDRLLLLLDSMRLNIFNFKFEVLEELLFLK